MIIKRGRGIAGEFEGDGVVPLRGSAEQREGPRVELVTPWKCPV
jgi:hypothetical protein